MTHPFLTAIAKELPASVPFVGPETIERQTGKLFDARIGANENGFGPSPKALEVMRDQADDIWKYADPENYELRNALAAHLDIGAENVMVGEGIDALLGYACRLLVEPGRKIVTTAGAYPTFNFHVAGTGGELVLVPMDEDREDPLALIARARETNAHLLYFSNPNNPMGTWHDAATVQKLIDELPEQMLLILDEAYIECAPEGTAPPIDITHPRLLRFRTFSKAYGMAGARVGYCFGEAGLVSQFNKLRNHFGMNRVAQKAALAALDDQDWLNDMRTNIAASRDRITSIAHENGFTALPSATNFVAIDCGRDGTYAAKIVAALAKHGVFIRMPGVAPQNRCIRVSCGPEEFMKQLEDALPKVVTELG